ncbi:DUF927 domain-containing protein [Limnobaculum xujianqingii]|uniref:DUF927 domain-containing protein n=1 Tax=Limnobaculum xujianqingii TaxID=2738837 RepID=UPI00112860FE|nr:DUF927 domain-containing protein [Limnobaculum xujianqingii]
MNNNIMHHEANALAELMIPTHSIPKGQKFTAQNGWPNAPVLTPEEVSIAVPEWEVRGCGLGIRTGFPLLGGGFLGIIDVDPHVGELTSEARVELHQTLISLGLPPTTPNVITGRCDDSCHYYVRFSDIESVSKAALKLSESKHKNTDGKPYWIIELLGKGKQVVSPPTIHPETGLPYRRISHNIMDAPVELLKRLTEQQVHTQGAQAKHTDPVTDSLANDQVLALVKEALSFINPNCDYPLWRDILWAIRDHQIHTAKEIAKEWSEQAQEKFDSNVFELTWESFNPNGGIHAATLYHHAQSQGWKGETYHLTALKNATVPTDDQRPCFRVFDNNIEYEGQNLSAGVWFFDIKPGDPPITNHIYICSPIHIEAVTCDLEERNFGRLLRFKNTLDIWHTWAMPMDLLAGSGDELRAILLSMGVGIAPKQKNLLMHYLQQGAPKRRMRCALQIGWTGNVFVLPDSTISDTTSTEVIFQSGQRPQEEYTVGGTLEGWQENVAALAQGNPLLVLGLCAAFAGPLLEKCHAESGGIHFYGDSSTGKTTLVEAACSVWGGKNYKRSWRATSNGMEGAAMMFNDTLLALDEISECAPQEVGNIIYSLGNGVGKQRASRTGLARATARWRCSVISSGELTTVATIEQSNTRVKAGQAVRLIDIPVQRTYGAWDNLHGFKTGNQFSDHLKAQSALHHGHAGRAFLESLIQDKRNFSHDLNTLVAFPDFSSNSPEGQIKRVARRFALLALAGELATTYGITKWKTGEALRAAITVFNNWKSLRGDTSTEYQQTINQLTSFIERHGDSRFASKIETSSITIRDRAGWWEDEPVSGERVYLFTASGLREALTGLDFQRALKNLRDAKILKLTDTSNKAVSKRIGKQTHRVYPICLQHQDD